MRATMFGGREGIHVSIDEEGYVFIDRSGEHFGAVLDYLRTGVLDASGGCHAALRRELDLFVLPMPEHAHGGGRAGYTLEDVKQYLLGGSKLYRMNLSGLDLSCLYFGLTHDEQLLWAGTMFSGADLSKTWFAGTPETGDGRVENGRKLAEAFDGAKMHNSRFPVFLFRVLAPVQRRQVGKVRVSDEITGVGWVSAAEGEEKLQVVVLHN
ncbi:hypothetical protein T492DRAFT_1059525 [Pavlovales sp. CCMP2436]|nr:hypothetical protein T492DRAFT_1059525 [Pavlovales sp. CCMP2436]